VSVREGYRHPHRVRRTVVGLLPEFRELAQKSAVLACSVASGDDLRAEQGANTTVGRGFEPPIVEDSLDSMEPRVVEAVDDRCIGDASVRAFVASSSAWCACCSSFSTNGRVSWGSGIRAPLTDDISDKRVPLSPVSGER